jgi:hypothetical protein
MEVELPAWENSLSSSSIVVRCKYVQALNVVIETELKQNTIALVKHGIGYFDIVVGESTVTYSLAKIIQARLTVSNKICAVFTKGKLVIFDSNLDLLPEEVTGNDLWLHRQRAFVTYLKNEGYCFDVWVGGQTSHGVSAKNG